MKKIATNKQKTQKRKNKKVPLFFSPVSAGFPSPASELIDHSLDLNSYLIKNPAATFFVKVSGDSMLDAGIHSDDILIIDRSIEVKTDHIILAVLNSEFTVKRFLKKNNRVMLKPENPKYEVIEIGELDEFIVWGVVTHVIHAFNS